MGCASWMRLNRSVPNGEGRSRPPIGLENMLRMYIAQQCFGLSDEAVEDTLSDSKAIRCFVGMELTPFTKTQTSKNPFAVFLVTIPPSNAWNPSIISISFT